MVQADIVGRNSTLVTLRVKGLNSQDSLKSGGTQDSETAAMKFWAVLSLVYLAIGADASKRKKVCKQMMGKLSDLEDLIKKKQDYCTVGKVSKV